MCTVSVLSKLSDRRQQLLAARWRIRDFASNVEEISRCDTSARRIA